MRTLALISIFTLSTLFTEEPMAILGGQGDAPYAAFLEADGTIVKLNGLPPTGLTYRVGMNRLGYGIIGGTDGINAYAALVNPQGILNPLQGLPTPGEIYTVDINSSGSGIIGGGHLNTNVPYAALVSGTGTVFSLNMPASGLIYGVAINDHRESIVGGVGPLNSAYASLVSPSGVVTEIAGLPTVGGIFWVDINNSKTRFIGGSDNTSLYAAFIDPNNTLRPINGLPLGILYSVGLNSSGNAIIGGTSLSLPYAALVSNNGSVNTLNGLPTTAGKIYNVAINSSGTGLIAGFSAEGPYGSFVASDGTLTPLKGLPTGDGFLDGAALHASGIGIVGGTSSNAPFAALAAPNGTLTFLNGLPSQGEINSIAIGLLDALVPKALLPFESYANTQFALTDTLTQHCIIRRGNDCFDQGDNYSLWVSGLGNYIHQKGTGFHSTFSNKIGGILAGFDYMALERVVLGGGVAYAYNGVDHSHGNASIDQESAVLYGTWNHDYFSMNVALWGGAFQAENTRHTLHLFTSKAKPCGWNLSPHIEFSSPILDSKCYSTFFMAFDWVNNWHSHFQERGESGFNVHLGNRHDNIVRYETGIRFFETIETELALFILEEKISYIGKYLAGHGKTSAAFIGSASSFDVATCDCRGQDLGNIQLHVECIPNGLNGVYGSFDYQGGFGSHYQSHLLTLSVGMLF